MGGNGLHRKGKRKAKFKRGPKPSIAERLAQSARDRNLRKSHISLDPGVEGFGPSPAEKIIPVVEEQKSVFRRMFSRKTGKRIALGMALLFIHKGVVWFYYIDARGFQRATITEVV